MMSVLKFRRNLLILLLFALTLTAYSQVYLDPEASLSDRVEDLLSRMTLREKIGQMLQAERTSGNLNALLADSAIGSVLSGGGSAPSPNTLEAWANMYDAFQEKALATRLGIPILYGIDAVHGNNNVYGSTIFPHNIGLGSTRDSLLVQRCAEITALEVAATGINWTFSPCIAVPRDERWGRTYEGFGETPEIQKTFAAASVIGYQGELPGEHNRIVACAKHFIADGGTLGGDDQGNAILTDDELRSVHLPGYISAIQNNVATIMASYNSVNGVKCHANSYLLTDLLKVELGFEGFVVSDWHAINQVGSTYKEGLKICINAGIDMAMEPYNATIFLQYMHELVEEGEIPVDRIDDAVRRILRVKFRFGLFESSYAKRDLFGQVGSPAHRDVAREAVRKSLVLLKNNNVLPIPPNHGKILVAGSKANNIGMQCGGWTISWQGGSGNITPGTTILDGVKKIAGDENVVFSDIGANGSDCSFAIVVIGESPYAEGLGDNQTLSISQAEKNLLNTVKAYDIPYVVVLLSGRPMMVTDIINSADAFVAAWLPGTEGDGIAEVLFGLYDFTGKLPHTWPANISQVPINIGDAVYEPAFSYGFGLDTTMKVGLKNMQIPTGTIFPNPARDYVTVTYSHPVSRIVITDCFGRQLYNTGNTQNLFNQYLIPLEEMIKVPGPYFLTGYFDNGRRVTQKLLVQR